MMRYAIVCSQIQAAELVAGHVSRLLLDSGFPQHPGLLPFVP
jgi:hypothetical protein